jgi:hypothetical protein
MTDRIVSKTYNPKACCNSDCYALDCNKNQDEPCWGDVEVIDEIVYDDDWSWIHACQGHKSCWEGKPYIPEGK